MESYDPHRLVEEVRELLEARGLTPHLVDGGKGQAIAGAGQLLRALGITPGLDHVEAMARAMDKPWAAMDDR
jgi:hypothetical protein